MFSKTQLARCFVFSTLFAGVLGLCEAPTNVLGIGQEELVVSTFTSSTQPCTNATKSTAWVTLTTETSVEAVEVISCSSSAHASSVQTDCSALQCLATSAPYQDDCQRLVFTVQADERYRIAIAVDDEQASVSVRAKALQLSPNNDCISALSFQDRIVASTQNATLAPVRDCRIQHEAPGVWYTVQGTGSLLRLSTCHPETNFDSALTIYSGDDCNNLSCIGGAQDDFECGFVDGSTYTWPSVQGQTYHVLVHGNSPENIGEFALEVSELPTVEHNTCETALQASIGSTVTGSTQLATADATLHALCALGSATPGVWYKIRGTGNPLRLSTCSSVTNFDTKLSILKSPQSDQSCSEGTMECVDSHDDDVLCDANIQASTVEFNTTASKEYYVLVHGALEASKGDFELSIEELPSTVVEPTTTSFGTTQAPSFVVTFTGFMSFH